MKDLAVLIEYVDNHLLPNLDIRSLNPSDPVVPKHVPEPWMLIGAGNYAAAFVHPDFPEHVIKVYAPERPGILEEVYVYSKIGKHPSFSECYYHTEKYLILKRLRGETLYSCINKGIPIPKKIINDIDKALRYAESRDLHPHDIHAKNVMMNQGQGLVVDISDFLKKEDCSLWNDFKKAYYKIYLPFFFKYHPPVPEFVLNAVRKGYKLFKSFSKKINR